MSLFGNLSPVIVESYLREIPTRSPSKIGLPPALFLFSSEAICTDLRMYDARCSHAYGRVSLSFAAKEKKICEI